MRQPMSHVSCYAHFLMLLTCWASHGSLSTNPLSLAVFNGASSSVRHLLMTERLTSAFTSGEMLQLAGYSTRGR